MQSDSNFFNLVMTLVIVALILFFIVMLSDMDNKWTARNLSNKNTGKNPSQKKTKSQKEYNCKHSYYEMASKQPLIETEDFLFAFNFMDLDIAVSFKKINEHKDIQNRPIPTSRQLKQMNRYYCPQCQRMETFLLDDICRMAIEARNTVEEEDAIKEIERKWTQIEIERQSAPKKGSWP